MALRMWTNKIRGHFEMNVEESRFAKDEKDGGFRRRIEVKLTDIHRNFGHRNGVLMLDPHRHDTHRCESLGHCS